MGALSLAFNSSEQHKFTKEADDPISVKNLVLENKDGVTEVS